MSSSIFSTESPREGIFWDYVEKLSRCEFTPKIITMLALSVLLVLTFLDVTPNFLRMITGGLSFVITLLLGAVRI